MFVAGVVRYNCAGMLTLKITLCEQRCSWPRLHNNTCRFLGLSNSTVESIPSVEVVPYKSRQLFEQLNSLPCKRSIV